MSRLVILVGLLLVAAAGLLMFQAARSGQASSPAPRIVIVAMPSGHRVTCIDFGEWGTCDLLGFTADTKAAK